MKFFYSSLVLFLTIFTLLGCQKTYDNRVKKGKIVLHRNNLVVEPLKLNGEWEFYWKEFLTHKDFHTDLQPEYVIVPGKWNHYNVNGQKVGSQSYGTYRVTVNLPKKNKKYQNLGIKMLSISSAYKLFINGQLLAAAGKIAKTKQEEIVDYKPQVLTLPPVVDQFEIIIHVSNFHHEKGGIWNQILLGDFHKLSSLRQKNIYFDIFQFSSILFMSAYHFVFFLQRRKTKSTLFFSLFTFLIAASSIFMKEITFLEFYDIDNMIHFSKIQYLSFYLAVPAFVFFIYNVFPVIDFKIKEIILLLSILLSLIVIFFPMNVFTVTSKYMELLAIFAIVYSFATLFRAMSLQLTAAFSFFLGGILFSIIVLNDILHTNDLIHTGYYASFGLLFFTFCQSFALSVYFSTALTEVEDLSISLEKKVEQRTNELEQANKMKDKFISIVSHDLRSPLSGIKDVLNLMIDKPERNDRLSLLGSAKETINHSLALIKHLLDLSRIQTGSLTLSYHDLEIGKLLQGIQEELKLPLFTKGLDLTIEYDEEVVTCDPLLMGELLKNLLSNAIKFSPKNSKIELLFTASSKYHCISVIDYGIGMTEDRLEKVFHLTSKQVSFGTEGETGTGFGLSLCRDIIKAHGGNIEIKSQVDLGTQVNVYLPSNERIVFLVDSNDAFRLRLKKELTSYESLLCIDFANPKSCLEMLQNTKPNTIITEFYFPEMNGIELCETIQQNGEFADISMILCTDLKKTRPNDKGLFSHIFSKSDKEVMKKIDSVIQNL